MIISGWGVSILIGNTLLQQAGLSPQESIPVLISFFQNSLGGILLYFVSFSLRPLVLFPAAILTMAAGIVWGPIWGSLIALFAATISALFPYLIGRLIYLSPEKRDDKSLQKENSRLFKRFSGSLKEYPFHTVFTMRMLFLPFDAVSLISGYAKVPLHSFVLASFFGNILGTIAVVLAGSSVSTSPETAQFSINPQLLIFSGGIAILSFSLQRIISPKRKSK